MLGLASTATLRRHITALKASTEARFKAAPGEAKVRRFKEFQDGAGTWSRVRRIIARVEAGPLGTDTRLIVTNLRQGSGRGLYEGLYCQHGQAENHVKARKAHLAADRSTAPLLIMHQGDGQPGPPVPACGGLPAAVEPAGCDAEALALAGRPVRQLAPAPGEDRRACRRDDDPDQGSPANKRPRSNRRSSRARPLATARHLSSGAACPVVTRSRQPPAPPQHQSSAACAPASDAIRFRNHKSNSSAHFGRLDQLGA